MLILSLSSAARRRRRPVIPTGSVYIRPDGVSRVLRPDAASLVNRPS